MDDNAAFEMTANIVNAAANVEASPSNSTKKKQTQRIPSGKYAPINNQLTQEISPL